MPLPIGPTRLHCTACDYTKLFVFRSDVIQAPQSCPKCGKNDLIFKSPLFPIPKTLWPLFK